MEHNTSTPQNPEPTNGPQLTPATPVEHGTVVQGPHRRKLPLPFIIAIAVVVLAAAGVGAWFLLRDQDDTAMKDSATNTPAASDTKFEAAKPAYAVSVVEQGKKVLPDGYADPTVIKTDTGYRMYASQQKGGGGIIIFSSSDGVTWRQEKAAGLPGVSTSRVIAWPGGGVRLYYPGTMPIKPSDPPASLFSALSTDGLTFTKDAGALIAPKSSAYYLEGPTVFQLADKTWRMYFNENSTAAGNQRDGIIWGASSADGTTWKRDSEPTLQADSAELGQRNNPSAWPQVLHPFVVKHPNGGYIMFYNTHSEIYTATSDDGTTWKKQGKVGIHGADVDGYFQADGSFRIYYGDFSEATGGLVYTGVLKITK